MTEVKEHHSELTEEENAHLTDILLAMQNYQVDVASVNWIFSKLDSMFQADNYFETLKQVPSALKYTEEVNIKILNSGISYALLSSERILDSMNYTGIPDMNFGLEKAHSLLSEAKSNFLSKDYLGVQRALLDFKILSRRLAEKQKVEISKQIAALESEISEIKNFGAKIGNSNTKLKETKKLLSLDLVVASTNALKSAKESIKLAREDRIDLIKETIVYVEKLTKAAYEIGCNVESTQFELDKANSLFEKGNYQLCMHATIKAEEFATDLIHKQAYKVRALQESIDYRYSAISNTEDKDENSQSQKENEGKIINQKNICPYCFNPIEYYDRYRRWYCAFCMKYL